MVEFWVFVLGLSILLYVLLDAIKNFQDHGKQRGPLKC